MVKSELRTPPLCWQPSRGTHHAPSLSCRVIPTVRRPLRRAWKSSARSRHAATGRRPAPSCSGLMQAALRRITWQASSPRSPSMIFQHSSGGMPQSTPPRAMCDNFCVVWIASLLMVQRSQATGSPRSVILLRLQRVLVWRSPTSHSYAKVVGETLSPPCLMTSLPRHT